MRRRWKKCLALTLVIFFLMTLLPLSVVTADEVPLLPPELDNMLIVGGTGISIDFLRNQRAEAASRINEALADDPTYIFVNLPGQFLNVRSGQPPTAGDAAGILGRMQGYWDNSGEWVDWDPSELPPIDELGELTVHFIDVGQGDAILVQAPSGAIMLIDGGPSAAGQKVVHYIEQLGIDSIDKVVATHPHADHIGGLVSVLETFPVGKVYDSGYPYDTLIFNSYMNIIETKGIEVVVAHRTNPINLCPELAITILHPGLTLMGDPNNSSIVLSLEHGEISFLFTGDAEKEAEQQMMDYVMNLLPSEILKVGHHGSRTSTSKEFLEAVNPEAAIIMCGKDNQYGHPHQETLQALTDAGVEIYRTDISGDIVVYSGGASYEIEAIPFIYEPEEPDPDEPIIPTKVNINTASFEDLQLIIHIGPARAQEIINLRPFGSLDGLLQVSGIGPARLQDIKDQGIAYVE